MMITIEIVADTHQTPAIRRWNFADAVGIRFEWIRTPTNSETTVVALFCRTGR